MAPSHYYYDDDDDEQIPQTQNPITHTTPLLCVFILIQLLYESIDPDNPTRILLNFQCWG